MMNTINALSIGAIGVTTGYLGGRLGDTVGGPVGSLLLGQAGGFLGLYLGKRFVVSYFPNGLSTNQTEKIDLIKKQLLSGAALASVWGLLCGPHGCSSRNCLVIDSFPCLFYFINSAVFFSTFVYFSYTTYKTISLISKSDYFREWIIDDKKINFSIVGQKINCEVHDTKTNEIDSIPFPPDADIAYLKQSEVIIYRGSLIFVKPDFTWWLGNKKVCLIRKDDRLLWTLTDHSIWKLFHSTLCTEFNRNSVLIHQTPNSTEAIPFLDFMPIKNWLKSDNSFSTTCSGLKLVDVHVQGKSLKTFDERAGLGSRSSIMKWKGKRRLFYHDEDEFTEYSYEGPFRLTFEPLTAKSRVEDKLRISSFLWAVRLYGHKGFMDNHVYILVEGVDNGKYFMYQADFTGDIIRARFIDEKPPIVQMTIAKKVRREKVEEMITSINKEAGKSIPFSYLGNTSEVGAVLNGERRHNCLTWAIEKLKIAGITFEKSSSDSIVALLKPRAYPYETFKHPSRPDLGNMN